MICLTQFGGIHRRLFEAQRGHRQEDIHQKLPMNNSITMNSSITLQLHSSTSVLPHQIFARLHPGASPLESMSNTWRWVSTHYHNNNNNKNNNNDDDDNNNTSNNCHNSNSRSKINSNNWTATDAHTQHQHTDNEHQQIEGQQLRPQQQGEHFNIERVYGLSMLLTTQNILHLEWHSSVQTPNILANNCSLRLLFDSTRFATIKWTSASSAATSATTNMVSLGKTYNKTNMNIEINKQSLQNRFASIRVLKQCAPCQHHTMEWTENSDNINISRMESNSHENINNDIVKNIEMNIIICISRR